MHTRHATPDKDAIALLPPFERLGLERITLVSTAEQARVAAAALTQATAWGFDTESKPTFKVGEVSDGPHIVQLATAAHLGVTGRYFMGRLPDGRPWVGQQSPQERLIGLLGERLAQERLI